MGVAVNLACITWLIDLSEGRSSKVDKNRMIDEGVDRSCLGRYTLTNKVLACKCGDAGVISVPEMLVLVLHWFRRCHAEGISLRQVAGTPRRLFEEKSKTTAHAKEQRGPIMTTL